MQSSQDGQWRTPPFKAQLRQWWRVAYYARNASDFRLERMRAREGEIFGDAASAGNSRRSRLRLRLSDWNIGTLRQADWKPLAALEHPEVSRQRVRADLYLGYGPVTPARLKSNAALQAGEAAELRMALVEESQETAESIDHALALMHAFGTLGGRSRNGWGSYALQPIAPSESPSVAISSVLRPWRDALALDWAHAVGASDDGRPLIWRTKRKTDWRAVMEQLARLKIALRTQPGFRFDSVRPPHHRPMPRHWLSYPVTNHEVTSWKDLRLPNSLRFKVRQTSDGKKVYGLIVHVPCSPPASFSPDRGALESVWSTVHAFLDDPALELRRDARPGTI